MNAFHKQPVLKGERGKSHLISLVSFPGTCFLFLFFILSYCTGYAQTAVNPDNEKNKELFTTIRSGDIAHLTALMNNGANANAEYDGFSALMAAALNGTKEEMDVLVQHGANVNYLTKDSLSALWMAVPDYEKTAYLLNHGANPQILSSEKYTVLVKAALYPGALDVMKLLVAKGCDPKKSAADNMLLYMSTSSGDSSIVGYLIRQGLSPNDTTYFGDYPLVMAMNYLSFECVKVLIDNGANVNVQSKNLPLQSMTGVTPLMWAAGQNDKRSFYYILEHGANTNLKSKSGLTALMFAQLAMIDDPEVTATLLKHGASVREKNNEGDDALTLARQKGNVQSVALIEQSMNH